MANMERETGVKETAAQIGREITAAQVDETYHGNSSSYDSSYDYGYGVDPMGNPVTDAAAEATGSEPSPNDHSTEGASATQGAETAVAEAEPPAAPEPEHVADTVPRAKSGAPANDGSTPA
jgi:hypothetical protein